MQYEFKNEIIAKMPEKLVIAATNLLVYYLIVEVNYTNLFLISKLIVLDIKFEVFKKTSFANDNLVKSKKQTKLDQCIVKQPKN